MSDGAGAHMSAIAAALRDAGTAKELARLVGASPRTVERWQRGHAEPGASSVFRLMARRRDLAARLLRAAGLDDASLAAERAHLDAQLAHLLARRATLDEPAHTSPPPDADAQGARVAVAGATRDGARATHPLRRATDRAVAVTPRCHEAGAVPAPDAPRVGSLDVSSLNSPPAAERTAGGIFSGEGT